MTTVQIFVTCRVDSFYPQTCETIVNILRRRGVTVEFRRIKPAADSPFNAGSRPIIEHAIRVFEKTTGDIVIPSGWSAYMIKHGYPELFQNEHGCLARAQTMGDRIYELTEYLVDQLGVAALKARWDGVLTYPSCHTHRGMKIGRSHAPYLHMSKVHRLWICRMLKNASASAASFR